MTKNKKKSSYNYDCGSLKQVFFRHPVYVNLKLPPKGCDIIYYPVYTRSVAYTGQVSFFNVPYQHGHV